MHWNQRLTSLNQLFFEAQATLSHKAKKERASRDLDPGRSLDCLGTAVSSFKL